MTIWFTADTHFNHANVIEYSKRPFADLAEMTETLVANWNSVVERGDTVFHLGDFALSWGKKHAELVDGLLSRLKGQKWLIKGNHDRDEVTRSKRWHMVKDYHEVKVSDQRIVLCHYALRTWNQSHRGSWMLHGHSHGSLADIGGKILDMGVDCWAYRPIAFEGVAFAMSQRPIVSVDHHEPESTQ